MAAAPVVPSHVSSAELDRALDSREFRQSLKRANAESEEAASIELLWKKIVEDVKAHRDIAYLWMHKDELDSIRKAAERLDAELRQDEKYLEKQGDRVYEKVRQIALEQDKKRMRAACEELVALLQRLTASDSWFANAHRDVLFIINEFHKTKPSYPLLKLFNRRFTSNLDSLRRQGLPVDIDPATEAFMSHHYNEIKDMNEGQLSLLAGYAKSKMILGSTEESFVNEFTWQLILELMIRPDGFRHIRTFSDFCKTQQGILNRESLLMMIKMFQKREEAMLRFMVAANDSGLAAKLKSLGLTDTEQQETFLKLLRYLWAKGRDMEYELKTALHLYVDFLQSELKKGKAASQIDIRDFWKYSRDLQKSKIIGPLLAKGDLVQLKDDKGNYVYNVENITPQGYFIVRATLDPVRGAVKGPYRYNQLQQFTESEDWTDIRELRKKGFLVLHATNAVARDRTGGIDFLLSDLKNPGKYTMSCSAISPKYKARIFLPKTALGVYQAFALGDVLSEGRLYAAYPFDAMTDMSKTGHQLYRASDVDKIPVRLALTSPNPYNELMPQRWKIEGIFYTDTQGYEGQTAEGLPRPKSINESLLGKYITIAKENKLKVYVIDFSTAKWAVYEYDKKTNRFILTEGMERKYAEAV